MNLAYEEVTEEKYNHLRELPEKQFYDEVRKNIPMAWACGYGWYGCGLEKKGDKYFIVHSLGDSCD